MDFWLACARVLLAVAIFIGFALLASVTARRLGANHRDMETRTSTAMLAVGLVANVAVLGCILAIIGFVDRRPLSSLGLTLTGHDAVVLAFAVAVTVALAAAFIAVRRVSGAVRVRRADADAADSRRGAMAVVAVLAVVALQEEVLFRGYITLNLLPFGWPAVVLASTGLFVGVHLLTNKTSTAQVLSWSVSAAILVLPYLLSGSIWVPVVLHLVTDVLNVVAFGIVGRYAVVVVTPPLSERARTTYRVIAGVAMAALFFVGYGLQVSPDLGEHQGAVAVSGSSTN